MQKIAFLVLFGMLLSSCDMFYSPSKPQDGYKSENDYQATDSFQEKIDKYSERN